jgi:hypothetical protein
MRGAVDIQGALLDLEELKRRQNEELLGVLETEQTKENEREALLQKVCTRGWCCGVARCSREAMQVESMAERRRLEKIFGVERAKANERIMRMTAYAQWRG